MEALQIQQYLEIIGNAFNQFVTSMQMPAQKIWELMIKQNYVYMWQEIIYAIIVLIVTIIWLSYIMYWFSKSQQQGVGERKISRFSKLGCYDEDPVQYITVALTIIAILGMLSVVFFSIPDIVARVINPEYMASKDLIQLLQNNLSGN